MGKVQKGVRIVINLLRKDIHSHLEVFSVCRDASVCLFISHMGHVWVTYTSVGHKSIGRVFRVSVSGFAKAAVPLNHSSARD